MTQPDQNVTVKRDTPRARTPSSGGSVTVSRMTTQRDVTGRERDSDMPPLRVSHHHHPKPKSTAKAKAGWVHIAAMNLIADHAAGIAVDPTKLLIAQRFMEAV